MRIVRALGGSVLWILAGVLGLVGVLLCVTVVLLPLGIPLLMLARRLFSFAMTLFLPRSVRRPVDELGRKARSRAEKAKDTLDKAELPKVKGRKVRKAARRSAKKATGVVGDAVPGKGRKRGLLRRRRRFG